ncbi:MAG TPA: pilus assembly PilX N-terminal domain-containing protein, partial [Gallionella sp.]|nr:pilus assembly PilX N-terminal domain-containing protein [Gallionella sp.]
TLVVGLIMLVLITLIVTSAFILSSSNLKSVGNMQFRNEAVSAANAAVEDVLSSLLSGGSTVQPPQQDIDVDLNNDTVADYHVHVNPPACIRLALIPGLSTPPGGGTSVTLGVPPAAPAFYNSVWDIDANVTDAASGASIRVRQGVRVLLNQAQCNAVCPPAPGTPCPSS